MLLARQGHPGSGSRKHGKNMGLKATYFNLFLLYIFTLGDSGFFRHQGIVKATVTGVF